MTGLVDKGRMAEKLLLSAVWRTDDLGGGDPINVYKYRMGGKEEKRDSLFSVTPTNRTRGNGHRLEHRTLCMNIFTVRVV